MKELRLQFMGDREGLHKQLNKWCADADMKMTPTIMEFIKRLTTDKTFAKSMKEWIEQSK